MSNAYTLITGASGGIGWELARQFAAGGHPVILVARNAAKLAERQAQLQEEFDVPVQIAAADLTLPDAAQRLFEETQGRGLAVDILVNNAGYGDFVAFLDADWARQRDMVTLNVTALMQLTYLYAEEMRRRGTGRILNVASLAAMSAGPYMATYYATKAFVFSFSQAMTEELKPYGITVTALCPGPTATNFEAAADMKGGNLFHALPVETAEKVARRGYLATMKGKPIRLCGITVQAMTLVSRLTPRSWNRRACMRINGTPTKKERT